MEYKANTISNNELVKSGMIYSPHFDDETLGCGGIIRRKITSGADVSVVFMTDGGRSDSQWMPADRLCQLRKSEGIAAVGELGVQDEKVFVLGFPEGRLMNQAALVRQQVTNLLEINKPEQVFLPYAEEPLMWSTDHVATTQIVLEAIRECPWRITVYEYPIWAWFHYPWIRLHRGTLRQTLKNSVDFRFGLRFLEDFNIKIDICDTLDQKWSALECHRSQMVELIPNVGWPTLGNIADGDFLGLFFKKYEYFRRS